MFRKTRTEKAQRAFRNKDVEASKSLHTEAEIEKHIEEHTKEKGLYLRDFVFGASDGIVTTFAVVSGVEGAKLSSSIVLILGFAKVFADAVSMTFGNYLSEKSEQDYIQREKEREEWEITHLPEGEREEIVQIFKKKGFKGKDLDRVVDVITSDKKVWVDTMMMHELRLNEADKTPVISSIVIFFSFILAGAIPLLAFVFALFVPLIGDLNPFYISIVLTGITLFIVGSLRSTVTGINWLRSGIEMLVIAGTAASVAYFIGMFLNGLGI